MIARTAEFMGARVSNRTEWATRLPWGRRIRAGFAVCLARGIVGVGAFVVVAMAVAVTGASATAQTAGPGIVLGQEPYAPLLREWWAEGTAAGNSGDFYENRDGNHSLLQLGEFPQLTRWPANPDSDPNDTGWGASRVVRPAIVVGNSSTAGTPPSGSSLGRRLVTFPDTFAILYQQYRANNLHVYPEHADHDPGNAGFVGWGDLYPANSPYLLNSQGSSRTDLPFVRAAVACLAAFRPDTKQALVENGLLMPALQMLFRSAATHLKGPEDYFTGRAHPSVMDPNTLDSARMAREAHRMEAGLLPPLARIQVVGEDRPSSVLGVDLFDTTTPERLADTPCSVARVWRSLDRTRRLIVSGESSFDTRDRELTYRWVVLRGDPSRITFRPLNARRSVVEIRFEWAGRQPVEPDSALASSRLEIALFVSNGEWWSPPAFLTWFGSDQELRTYAPDGRLLDVGHCAGGVAVEIRELTPFLDWLNGAPGNPGARLFLEAAEIQVRTSGAAPVESLADQLGRLEAGIRDAEAREGAAQKVMELALAGRQEAATALAQAEADAKANGTDPNSPAIQNLRKDLETKSATATAALSAYQTARAETATVTDPPRRLVAQRFQSLAEDPYFCRDYAHLLSPLWRDSASSIRNFINTARNRLFAFGVVPGDTDWTFASASALAGFTEFEKNLLAEFHTKLIGQVVRPGGVTLRFGVHAIDSGLFVAKDYRDVHQHDASGRMIGWRRHRAGGVEEFSADGHLVLSRDPIGRPHEAAGVRYFAPPPSAAGTGSPAYLQSELTDARYVYQYSGDTDLRGRPFESR